MALFFILSGRRIRDEKTYPGQEKKRYFLKSPFVVFFMTGRKEK